MIELYFSTVKILAQRPTHIFAVARERERRRVRTQLKKNRTDQTRNQLKAKRKKTSHKQTGNSVVS